MSLLPASASFEEVVQDCFLAYRGSGLMLSALDMELLTQWARQNVPVEVVIRGIRAAAEKASWDARPDMPALKSLRQCRRSVETEIQRYQRANAGSGAATQNVSAEQRWHRQWLEVLETARGRHPPLSSLCEQLTQTVLAGAPASFEQTAVLDDVLWARLLRALPFPRRFSIYEETARRLGDLPSPRARKMAQRFHRMVLVKGTLV